MKFLTYAAAAAASVVSALAQDSDMSICDKYTTALLMENNATNQQTVLTLVVNTALIGNYPNPVEPMNNVTGILNPGMYNGENVNLLPVSYSKACREHYYYYYSHKLIQIFILSLTSTLTARLQARTVTIRLSLSTSSTAAVLTRSR